MNHVVLRLLLLRLLPRGRLLSVVNPRVVVVFFAALGECDRSCVVTNCRLHTAEDGHFGHSAYLGAKFDYLLHYLVYPILVKI